MLFWYFEDEAGGHLLNLDADDDLDFSFKVNVSLQFSTIDIYVGY